MHLGNEKGGNAVMFGRLLRHFRERAGLSQEALGLRIGFSKSQVAMVERGNRPPRGGFVEGADDAVGAQGALMAAGEGITGSYLADWFEELAKLERKAAARHAYETHVVPGLLQTEAYARTVLQACYPPEDDDVIEGRVADRLARQSLITRKDVPELSFVIELSALARPIGGRAAHRKQIAHILDVAHMRHVTLQVMSPNRETHGGLSGPFVLLETKERRRLAYLEVQSQSLLADEDPIVAILFGKYGTLRAQALSPEESHTEIEKLAR
ncbi:helix-turn-helix domain-containing protein [Streptomyces microflavus]|uniref:helix-turn-helix domain-containing protein n=2 Tax=Streptomyces TaxID=1883 RepID=UPI000823BFC8|nr:Predicted transcriptional regulators [Streptomyces sp. ScaeMP-e48]